VAQIGFVGRCLLAGVPERRGPGVRRHAHRSPASVATGALPGAPSATVAR